MGDQPDPAGVDLEVLAASGHPFDSPPDQRVDRWVVGLQRGDMGDARLGDLVAGEFVVEEPPERFDLG